MERRLLCNTLKCRRELNDRALVTTCSHIFCVECAQRYGIGGQDPERRSLCPACHTQLTDPDSAVITTLNPSEDYKTSVLSGLSPNTIMECTGRALSFWAYQTAQDMTYQEHLYRTLTSKYANLSMQLEKTMHDANAEAEEFQRKLAGMAAEQEALRQKNDDLAQTNKERGRKVLQLQELYDKIKRKAELGEIQRAASDTVDSTLQTSQLDQGYGGGMPNQGLHHGTPAPGYGHRIDISRMNTSIPRSYPNVTREGNQWTGLGGPARSDCTGTPLGGFGRPGVGGTSSASGTSGLPSMTGTPLPSFGGTRQFSAAHGTTFGPHRKNMPNIGLSSGIRVSQPTNMPGLDIPMRHL